MAHIHKTYEVLFDYNGEGEVLYEVSATYNYDSEVLHIEYVYDLEIAKYVEFENWLNKHKFEQTVIDDLTYRGEWQEDDNSDYHYDMYGDR